MNDLKKKNATKCVSLLREFIENAPAAANQKRVAVLALDHLRNIQAGTDTALPDPSIPNCNGRPRAG